MIDIMRIYFVQRLYFIFVSVEKLEIGPRCQDAGKSQAG